MKTRDIDIRQKLHKELSSQYKNRTDTIVVDELNLCQGDARIDIAVVNGKIHGYEIKSESDTLERLPNQISIYNQVMDTITIVTAEKHLEKVKQLIPAWWGIKIVEKKSRSINIRTIRRSKKNFCINSYSLAQLLWKDEALSILEKVGLDKGYRSKPRIKMWERLAENLPLDKLQCCVRQSLKNRKGWRVG